MLVRAAQPVRLECVVRGYLFGVGVERVPGARARCGGRPLPAGLQPGRAAAGAALHATTKAESGHDLPLTDAEAADARRRRPSTSSCATLSLAVYEFGAAHARRARAHPRRHQVRVRRARRRAPRDRRDDDARLVALLAAPTSTRSATSPPSFDKQYVRDYYLDAPAGTTTPPAPPLPAEVIDGHARALRRGLRAAHRRELRRLVRPGRVSRRGSIDAMPRVRSARRRHPPARHRSTRRARRSSGRSRRSATRTSPQVHIGKTIRLVVDADADADAARAQVDEMCERLLANPVIEAYDGRRSRSWSRRERARRRRPVPGHELRARRRVGGRAARRRGRAALARRRARCTASTRSSCPAASPTATTCAPARSPASRR